MTKTFATALIALSLVACGGKAEDDSAAGSGGSGAVGSGGAATGGKPATGGGTSVGGSSTGGNSTGGASTGGSSAGGAPSGGAGGNPSGGAPSGGTGGGECVPQTGGGTGGWEQPTCNDLSVMNVTDPVVVDDSGDGAVSPGEKFVVHANLNEVAGVGFNMYPGVYFVSSEPGVTIKEDNWFYAIFACTTDPVTAQGEIAADVAPGTVITVTARVGMINEDCPNAPSIQIPITIQ